MSKAFRVTPLALSLVCLLAASACQRHADPATDDQDSTSKNVVARAMERAASETKQRLETENISIGPGGEGIQFGRRKGDLPKAEITPQGDLLIEGKKVAVDAAQRALLLEYRRQIAAVAEAGIRVGAQGVDLAGKAVSEAIKGVFSGNTDQVEQRVEAEAQRIEVSAKQLCDLLPAMLATQQQLAASLPEFKPYANMDQDDVEGCMSDHDSSHRDSRDDGADGHMNAAEEADAAAVPAKQ